MHDLLLVGLGCILGANARYAVSNWTAKRFGTAFPWGTLCVNLTGSLVLAAILTVPAGAVLAGADLRLLLATGFLGSYTTFSTFSFETLALLREGAYGLAGLNVLGSTLFCLLAAALGVALGRAL